MTTEHQIEDEGFTAPTESVTIVLSRERYEQLRNELCAAIGWHAARGNTDRCSEATDLYHIITAREEVK